MNFRFFYLWLRSSTVLPYSLSKNRIFIERCLARRKLFSSYSNLIQNSLWTSTQHPLFSKGQFGYFKTQVRRTFIRILFIVIFYCLTYGTYTYMTQTSSLSSRFYFFIPFLQLFYLLLVNILFFFFFSFFNSLIVLSELLCFTFLKSFALYLKQLIIHRTFLSVNTPVKVFNDVFDIELKPQTYTPYTGSLNDLPVNFYKLKKSTEYRLSSYRTFPLGSYFQTHTNVKCLSDLDYFSIEYNLTNTVRFYIHLNNSFTELWAYYWDALYKKCVNFSLINHWLSTNPIVSYSDLRLAAETFSLFHTPQPSSLTLNNSPLFNAFKRSIVFLLGRQSTFFENSLFFRAQSPSLFYDNQLHATASNHVILPPTHRLSEFMIYLDLYNRHTSFFSLRNPAETNFNLLNFSKFFIFTDLRLLGYKLNLLQLPAEHSTFNLELYAFVFDSLFIDDNELFCNFFEDVTFSRNSFIRINFLN